MRAVRCPVWRIPILAVGLLLVFSSTSRAELISGFAVYNTPDILGRYFTTTYDGTTLTATGTSVSYNDGTSTKSINGGAGSTFTLRANVNSAGVFSGGSVQIFGKTPGGASGSPIINLFSSTQLLNFGFAPVVNGTLQFVFGSISGALVGSGPGYYDANRPVGVILTGINFPGGFSSPWTTPVSGLGIGAADLKPIAAPEPSTLTLLLLGAGGVARSVRKRLKGTAPAAA